MYSRHDLDMISVRKSGGKRTFLLSSGARQQSTLCTSMLLSFENGDIPHEGFLSMNDLPSVVRLSDSLSIKGIETCPSVIDTTSPVEANDYS